MHGNTCKAIVVAAQVAFSITTTVNGNRESFVLVSCPAHAHLPARNGLANEVKFLRLVQKSGKDR